MHRAALAAAAGACALVLALVLGEALVRLGGGPPARFLFGGSFRDHQSDFDVVYGVTDDGRRRSCGPEAGSERIAVLGDSFVFGQGVGDCDTFVSRLNLGSPRRRYLNFGLIGAGIDQYELVARDLLDGTSGALVAFYGNDVKDLDPARSALGRLGDRSSLAALLRHSVRAWRLARLLAVAADDGGPIAFFDGRPNNVLSALRADPDLMRRMVEPSPSQTGPFRAHFAALAALLVERFGAERVWITCIPDGQTVSRPLAAFIREHGGNLAPFGAAGPAYELVRALAQEHGLAFIDVFPGFATDGDALYFPHDLHWTVAGHRRMAELLAAPLGAAGAAPGAPAL